MNKFTYLNVIVLSWLVNLVGKDENEVEDETSNKIDFAVGGQAVLEGVMMRSPNHLTIAVRKKNGDIKIQKKPYQTITQRIKSLNIPILRGVINLFEMMVVGTTAINFSANEMLDDELTPEEKAKMEAKKDKALSKFIEAALFVGSFVFAIALSIFLFKFVPLWTTTFLEGRSAAIADNYILFNLIDGVLKMAIFLGYILLLSRFPSFHRIFEYHGAEHKSIFTYESDKELTPENATKQSRFHPRCGTSFILIVFVISIAVYTFIPKQETFWANLGIRLAALPFIAGISYEYLKLSAKYVDNKIVKALVSPGLWLQKITTQEPDKEQIEVGLKSLKTALALEKVKH